MIRDRLMREAETNVAIRVTESADKDSFEVAGRGAPAMGGWIPEAEIPGLHAQAHVAALAGLEFELREAAQLLVGSGQAGLQVVEVELNGLDAPALADVRDAQL